MKSATMLKRFLQSARFSATTTEATPANKVLKLSFACPHVTFFKKETVLQVNLSAEDGDMGILAGHVPTLIQLRPGTLSIMTGNKENPRQDFFVAGGFATVNPDSELHVAAMEAVPLDQIDPEAVKKGLVEATNLMAKNSNSSDAKEKASSQLALQVFQAMNEAINKVK
jgi:F-type H+-transporting ATPase subunit delta